MEYNKVFNLIAKNSIEVVDETIRILEKLADNIMKEPSNSKYRTLQKTNATIQTKIMSMKGGAECLKLMGFKEVSAYDF